MTLFELVAKLRLDSSEYEQGLGEAAEKSGSIGSKIGKGLATVGKAGAAAVTAATAATVAFSKTAVDAGMAFDSSMAQVAATMGKPVEEIQELREFAQQMGATTAFSATEAANALNYMALAGYDAETSMKMLPNVLNLAAAGGMDLATASDMVTDTQSALGLTLEETEIMVDQMARTSSKTNTSVAQLGDAMLKIGATARGVKGGTAELSAVLGVLADNGIKGAEGGTHLRNIILSLGKSSDASVAALESIGKSYDDFYTETGELKALPDIFMELNEAMDGLDQRSRDNIISTLFNSTDLAAVNSLLGTQADRWEELEVEIGNATGAAEDMADTQLDNLAGDMTLFQSALEGAQIAVSDQLTPTIREFVQLGSQALSDMTQGFLDGGIAGAMEGLSTFVSNGIELLADKIPMFIEAGAGVLGAVIQGITQNVPKLAEATVTIASSMATMLMENLPLVVNAGTQMIAELGNGLGQALPELVPMAVEAVLTLADSLIENAPALVDGAIALITGLGEGLINALPMLIERVPQIIQSLTMAIIQGIPKIGEAGGKLLGSLFAKLPEVTVSLLKGVGTLIESIVQASFGGVASMIWAGGELIMGLGKGLVDGAVKVIESAKKIASDVLGAIKGFFGIHSPSLVMEKEVGQQLTLGIDKGMKDKISELERTSDDLGSVITPEVQAIKPSTGTGGGNGNLEAIMLQMLDAFSKMGVVLDGKAVVGYLAPYIDTELGRIINNRVREATYI